MLRYKQWIAVDNQKHPIHYQHGHNIDHTKPENWHDYDTIKSSGHLMGFVLTETDPYFFIDIDKCYDPRIQKWDDIVYDIINMFPGAYTETSVSGLGIHIIGSARVDHNHRCKNSVHGVEFYTKERFLIYTGTGSGNPDLDQSAPLALFVNTYMPPKPIHEASAEWTDTECPGAKLIADDDDLIKKACSSVGFGLNCSFKALWTADEDELSRHYPDNYADRPYDSSSADAALAQHLAFWTGKNCERIKRLMMRSKLYREKYNRDDYLHRTILNAVSICKQFYSNSKLKAKSPKQREYAEEIRNNILDRCNPEQAEKLLTHSGPQRDAAFWINNQKESIESLVQMVTPTTEFIQFVDKPTILTGYQYMPIDRQLEFFKGCVYIQDSHRVFTPSGKILDQPRFNATYGGYDFQLTDTSDKTTRKAWDAFTESQAIRFPKVSTMCFKPTEPPGAIIDDQVNVYTPIETPAIQGDTSLFLDLLKKLLPDDNDRLILISYMAAIVQYKGVKFQWAPLIQGVEGNGKTLLTRCIKYCIGAKYCHMPKASEIGNKFNGWLLNKIFIGVEDIKVSHDQMAILETLKPMITADDGLEIEAKNQDQKTYDICANFIFNSNHKDAIRKTVNDRRFAVFYTAQQCADDLIRDGLNGDYFPKIYNWLKFNDGYANVHYYLLNFPIPDEYNPATKLQRAPQTSSTQEAIEQSMGFVEQELLDCIGEEIPGFKNGWLNLTMAKSIISNKRSISHRALANAIKNIGYILHPNLSGGKLTQLIMGRRPKIYIIKDHYSLNYSDSSIITEAYIKDND